MDKSWMRLSRVSNGYLAGVDSFLDFAFSHTSNPRNSCTCTKFFMDDFYQRETGRPVDEVELFKITHTSRKKNGAFVDDSSRVAAERMDAVIRENTTEEGICTVPTRAAVTQVIPGTKNRERMMGKPVPKAKEKLLTQSDVVRIEREAHDKAAREFDEKLAAMRAEFNARFEAMAHYQSQTHDTSRASQTHDTSRAEP